MRFAAILGLFAFVVACSPQRPMERRLDPWGQPQIDFAGSDLANYTAVGVPVMERVNGILYVTVPIRSTSIYELRIDYRVTFLNAQGTPIYTGQWEGGKKLMQDVQDYIKFNSPDPNAANFHLSIRYSQ